MYAVVYDETRQAYCIVLAKIAKKHDFLTVIEQAPTYRQAEKILKELKKNEMKGGDIP